VLILGIVAGLLFGLLAGGRLDHLAGVRLRWMAVLLAGLLLRFGVGLAIDNGVSIVGDYRLPLYAIAFGLVLVGLWANRAYPGLSLAFVGVALNLVAVSANGGFMPVWIPSLVAAGFPATEPLSSFHVVLPQATDVDFILRAGPFGDIIPVPIPFLRNVASVGDLFLASGLAFFLFATTVRTPAELDEFAEARIAGRLASMRAGLAAGTFAGTDLAPGLAQAATLDRPLVLGGSASGLAAPGAAPIVVYIPPPTAPPIVERLRRHPYVRLALDGSFSALWLGQLISLFGDRVHLVALTFLVLGVTDSAIAVAVVFLVATIPNLLFGPVAGTLVDRWDHREVMIVSDLLRAGIVLLIPVAATINLVLVYPLVFLVTTVSIFFRPAKGAIIPRLVADQDLLPANSAMWVGETLADIVGYALAGLFVGFLGSQLPLAFWIDAVTYIASAVLLATIVVAPAARAGADLLAAAGAVAAERAVSLFGQVREGWRFLRGERALLANTVQAAVAQFMLGTFLVLTPLYARDAIAIHGVGFDEKEVYSFLEGSIGAGNLVGGFIVGLIGARLSLGRLVILGYAITGACVAALALTGNLGAAIGLAFGAGAGNLVFVIPSQTLFHRRTPPEFMARVLAFRSSLVFGSMTIAMAVGGILGEAFGAATVIGAFGLVTVVAGLAGLLVPAVRDA
jgi:MFS family permease